MNDNTFFICTMAKRSHERATRILNKYEAGQIAEAITQIETGQTARAALRLRLLLRQSGHPEPAGILYEIKERP